MDLCEDVVAFDRVENSGLRGTVSGQVIRKPWHVRLPYHARSQRVSEVTAQIGILLIVSFDRLATDRTVSQVRIGLGFRLRRHVA